MALPVQSLKQLTVHYGRRTAKTPFGHRGTDFGWYAGGKIYSRNVYAIQAGTVYTGKQPLRAGKYINLLASGDKRWFYAHLEKQYVLNGQRVKAGQLIGVMGDTGYAFGVHLHLGLYIAGIQSNPEKHLSAPKPKPKPKKKKSVTTIAKEVIAGKWRVGKTRKRLLKKAGYSYRAVQAKVNKLLRRK